MRVENGESGVEFAGADPCKIQLSSNQSPGIPASGESEAAKHGRPIAARHNGFARGVAERLITPALRPSAPTIGVECGGKGTDTVRL